MLTVDELKARRNSLTLTQDEFCKMLGVSRDHYSRIESGVLPISARTEKRYDAIFGKRLIDPAKSDERITKLAYAITEMLRVSVCTESEQLAALDAVKNKLKKV